MPYCDKCGAYIPDGQEKCLACGYDANKEKRQAEQTAAQSEYYTNANEELRKKLEEHERLKRELDEKQRLQQKLEEERRQQQEQAKAWAEQEKQRREAERKKAEWKAYNDAHTTKTNNPQQSSSSWSASRLFSAMSYVSGLFVIPLICRREDENAMFHAKQGLRLFVFSLICDVIGRLPLVRGIIQLARIYLVIQGIYNAVTDKKVPLPFIGKIGM